MNNLPSSNINEVELRYLVTRETFVIPHFQREYSWTEKEINELFDDLLTSFNNGETGYLLGNIVFLTFDRKELLLFDGQQRLTTIIIIMEQIAKNIIKYPSLKDAVEKIIYSLDSNYKINYNQSKLQKDVNGDLLNFSVPDHIRDFINNKVKDEILSIDNFEEEGSIIDFLMNISFVVQTYYSSNNDKNKVILQILEYFVKFNTRGKQFDQSETEKVISLLKEAKTSEK